jgi:hypothetical protein
MGGGLSVFGKGGFGLGGRCRCPLSGSASPNTDTFAEDMSRTRLVSLPGAII